MSVRIEMTQLCGRDVCGGSIVYLDGVTPHCEELVQQIIISPLSSISTTGSFSCVLSV